MPRHYLFFCLFTISFSACRNKSVRPYPAVLTSIQGMQDSLISLHKSRNNEQTLIAARNALYHAIVDSLIPCWYGTGWDFNGTTQSPGEGRIACGYFVTTVLRDACLPVERVRMAQCASSVLIRTTCYRQSIVYHQSLAALQEALTALPAGSLLLIGLDTHVGFISHEAGGDFVLHAGTSGVVREPLAESAPVLHSRTLMTGNLLANDSMVSCWMDGPGNTLR